MDIFRDNPVLEREIRGRLRLKRKGGRQVNLWIVRLLGLVIVYFYARGLLSVGYGTPRDAQDFWPLLAFGALGLCVLLAPALSATAITQEREQQTWETLATTRLSAAEVLLGKWLGRQIILWMLLIILLPLMVVCAYRAQFGWLMLPSVLGFLLLTTAGYSALGLLCSFQAKRTMTATASALTGTALLCIGTVVVAQVLNALLLPGTQGNGQWPVLWINPFYALNSLMEQLSPNTLRSGPGDDPTASLWYLLSSAAATAAALLFMMRRYHRSVRERN